MNHKKLYFLLLLLTIVTPNKCMEQKEIQQLAIIKPFCNKLKSITKLTSIMDDIEHAGLSYPDYDKRSGLIFSEFTVKTAQPEKMLELPKRKVRILVDKQLQDYSAQSPFDYPKILKILAQQILPTTFKYITENKWAVLPEELIAGFYLQRCHTGDPMDWHQDPGEYHDPQANFSLVLMLSKQDDPLHGWIGGEFKIKSGLPKEIHSEVDVKTIIHEYNQAVLFNNQINSHAVTEVLSNMIQSKRDIAVLTLYFGKRSGPIDNTENK